MGLHFANPTYMAKMMGLATNLSHYYEFSVHVGSRNRDGAQKFMRI